MARRAAAAFIAAYLLTLGYGLASHTIGYKTYAHFGMYYIVWDMFCGWTGWECRTHIIAEGESGAYYDVGTAPWGEVCMYGAGDRRHYDQTGIHAPTIGRHIANHTDHEPLVRYLVVEESWAKKYNLPDHLWSQRYEEAKELKSYRRIRAAYDADGECFAVNPSWQSWLLTQAVNDNPRLRNDMTRTMPFMTTGEFARAPNVVVPVGHNVPAEEANP
jgi:hypothetical protein